MHLILDYFQQFVLNFCNLFPDYIYTSMNIHGMVKYLHEVTEGGECTMKNSE